ncbi:hypothetical protein BST61_g5826 [Cercospora zeina]
MWEKRRISKGQAQPRTVKQVARAPHVFPKEGGSSDNSLSHITDITFCRRATCSLTPASSSP